MEASGGVWRTNKWKLNSFFASGHAKISTQNQIDQDGQRKHIHKLLPRYEQKKRYVGEDSPCSGCFLRRERHCSLFDRSRETRAERNSGKKPSGRPREIL